MLSQNQTVLNSWGIKSKLDANYLKFAYLYNTFTIDLPVFSQGGYITEHPLHTIMNLASLYIYIYIYIYMRGR